MLTEYLRDALGRDDVVFTVRAGRARPNRKLLLHAVSRTGESIAFAKVGWNDVTRPLIRNEAAVLASLAERQRQERPFIAPRCLHSGSWYGLETLLLSPLLASPLRSRDAAHATVLAATRAVMSGSSEEVALAETDFWRVRRERAAATVDRHLERLAERLERRFGRRPVTLAGWHGDWTPWNMGWVDGRLAVWDWERSGELVPRGLDAAHYDYQLALAQRSEAVAGARRAAQPGGPLLRALDVPHERAHVLVALELLEMSLRREEGRGGGVDLGASPHVRALEALVFGD